MRDTLEDWLDEDVGKGDFTSQAVVEDSSCEAQVTGGPGIVSGIEVVKRLLNMVNVDYQTFFSDGSKIELGDVVFSLKGKSHSILKVERLLLNILCHLSGVATLTAEIVALAKSVNPHVEILATRKTIPGFREFEKEAVVHGGGRTHRIRLDDGILIKDNHLKLNKSISKAVMNSKQKYPDLMIEVEADTPEQALEAAKCNADRVMLDNFTPKIVKSTVPKIKSISDIEIEISGGVNMENIVDYAPYADFISLSSLTMASPPVDFSLHVI